jgi:hypothetical protein
VNHGLPEGATFRKASGCADKNCVEVAVTPDAVGMRDSKDNGHGAVLTFTPDEWAAFLGAARKGEFDLPV